MKEQRIKGEIKRQNEPLILFLIVISIFSCFGLPVVFFILVRLPFFLATKIRAFSLAHVFKVRPHKCRRFAQGNDVRGDNVRACVSVCILGFWAC